MNREYYYIPIKKVKILNKKPRCQDFLNINKILGKEPMNGYTDQII